MFSRIALRTTASVSRVGAVRFTSSVKEGSVATSREFSKKEKAHEDQYIREHEKQILSKLREEIEKKKNELAALEKEHDSKVSGSK